MKSILVWSWLLLLYLNVISIEGSNSTITTKTSNSKEVEKLFYPKKVGSLKKNIAKTSLKKIANITEKFKDLSADDLTFIKELDKQFQLYGGKVKIKVENKNDSETKTSKRTIDGELGYGYAHNGYHYNTPKFMFYPYSQKDIQASGGNNFAAGDVKTEVSIEPSYSYELKSQNYVTHNEPQIDVPNVAQHLTEQQYFGQKQQQYEEPVIVLRIPGPAKYATHLQMLLQKYLEIRAAQYLHILEEAEYRNQQQLHQQKQQQQQQQQPHHNYHQQLQFDNGQENNIIPESPIQHVGHKHLHEGYDSPQQIQYEQQNVVTTSSQQYPEIDNVYHNYKNKYTTHHKQVEQAPPAYYATQSNEEQYTPQYEHQPPLQQQQHHHQQQQQRQQQQQHLQYQQQQEEEQEQPLLYYTHQQQYAQPAGPPANIYHQVYLVAMIPHQQADYEAAQVQIENQQPIYVQDQIHHNEAEASTLPLAENNPRPSHTRVVFTNKQQHSTSDNQMYALPSIKPNERHEPKSTPNHHQDFQHTQQQKQQQKQQQQLQDYQNLQGKHVKQESANNYEEIYNTAAITQRPYNYHAHNVKVQAREKLANSRRATRAKDNDKNLQKIREFVRDKWAAEPGSAEEFKTYVDV